jgi:hypothetical protein
MSAPLFHPITAKSPVEWARAEAVALDQHAARMEASHGPNTKGAPLCRSRAAALRWLADAASKQAGASEALPEPRRGDTPNPDSIRAAALEEAAKVAERMYADDRWHGTVRSVAQNIAAAIRALGEK